MKTKHGVYDNNRDSAEHLWAKAGLHSWEGVVFGRKERHKRRYELLGPASIRVSDLDVRAGDGENISLISSCKLLILQIWDHIFIAMDREHTLDGLDVYISCVRYWKLLSESFMYTCQLQEKNLFNHWFPSKETNSKQEHTTK